MEHAQEWTSKNNKPEAQEQTHGASRCMEQAEAWSTQKQSHWSRKVDGALQKNGTSRSQEQAEARSKQKHVVSRSQEQQK
jgi:hypothetical protein